MTYKIALVQHKAKPNDTNKNIKLALKYCTLAKEGNANLVLFPEMWNNAYAFPFSVQNCIDVNYLDSFCAIAKQLQIHIVITALTQKDSQLYNSAFLISNKGLILMQYDKVHTCDFGFESVLTSGSSFNVCEVDGIKIGIMICYDREFPESARVLMLEGAELILVPNACDMNPARLNQLSARAFENMAGVAMANYPHKNWGNSCAFSPIVFDDEGNYTENTLFMADNISEDVYFVTFNIDKIREYRENETWGNAYRKVNTYAVLLDSKINPPFVRTKK